MGHIDAILTKLAARATCIKLSMFEQAAAQQGFAPRKVAAGDALTTGDGIDRMAEPRCAGTRRPPLGGMNLLRRWLGSLRCRAARCFLATVTACICACAAMPLAIPRAFASKTIRISLDGSCTSDQSDALQASVRLASRESSAKNPAVVQIRPAIAQCYLLLRPVELESYVEIVGAPGVVFRSEHTAFIVRGKTGVAIRSITIDDMANPRTFSPVLLIENSSEIMLERLVILNAPGQIEIRDSEHVSIDHTVVHDSLRHGISLSNTNFSSIVGCEFEGGVGFGVYLRKRSHDNIIRGNKTAGNGLELVGATHDTFHNQIIENRAEHTGDNCFSVSGSDNVVSRNIARGCDGNGIGIYGDRNVVADNVIRNNAQKPKRQSGWKAGIAIVPAFGGSGQFNKVTRNLIEDDQSDPTQHIGIWLAPTYYAEWAPNRFSKAGSYAVWGSHLYIAEQGGTSGGILPACNINMCHDGSITWKLVRPLDGGSAKADFNEIFSNAVGIGSTIKVLDDSNASHNQITQGR